MNLSPFPEGFAERSPTVPIREIPRPAALSPNLADFPFRMGEVIEQFRMIRSFPAGYFDRVEEMRLKAREFSDRFIRPNALEIEKKVSADPSYFAWDIMKKACDYRFFSIIIPEQFDGCGYSVLHMGVMAEELAVGCAGLASTIGVHSAGISCGLLSADAYILEKYIHPVALAEKRGEPILWSGAVTEPNAGTDIWDEEFLSKAALGTFADKVPGGWKINGKKCFISNGSVSKFTVIAAVTDRKAPAASWSIFLVPTDRKGFSVGRIERKMGQKASPASEQILEDVFVEDELLIGAQGYGPRGVSVYLAGSRGPVGAIGTGCARRSLECLIDWAKQKKNGSGRLIDQQALQLEMASMARDIFFARQAYIASCIACDQIMLGILGSPAIKLALSLIPKFFMRSGIGKTILRSKPVRDYMMNLLFKAAPDDWVNHGSAMATAAKILGSDTGVKVSGRVMEIMGPDSFDPRWPVEKAYRDAKLTQIYEGANGANSITCFKNMVGLMSEGSRPSPT
jgi:acyl-CoA dehydrogenase